MITRSNWFKPSPSEHRTARLFRVGYGSPFRTGLGLPTMLRLRRRRSDRLWEPIGICQTCCVARPTMGASSRSASPERSRLTGVRAISRGPWLWVMNLRPKLASVFHVALG